MSISLSPNTQVTLLLTAPLITGRQEPSADLLTPREFTRLTKLLATTERQPADLLGSEPKEFSKEFHTLVNDDRLKRLLERGLLLTQAVERWHTRAIWVVSQTDPEYPKLIKERLKELAPALIYGCGERAILDNGGLAVVGSRDADSWLV